LEVKGMAMMSIRKLGPFKVDASGLISPATPSMFPRFFVRWRDRMVQARMLQPNPDDLTHGTLEIVTRVGRIPSTGMATGASDSRAVALDLTRTLPKLLPEGWKMRLSPDHSVVFEAQAVLVLPVSAISLVTQVSMFLLSLNPYLDALDAGGVGPLAGTANT
jgi:hypothetical protein